MTQDSINTANVTMASDSASERQMHDRAAGKPVIGAAGLASVPSFNPTTQGSMSGAEGLEHTMLPASQRQTIGRAASEKVTTSKPMFRSANLASVPSLSSTTLQGRGQTADPRRTQKAAPERQTSGAKGAAERQIPGKRGPSGPNLTDGINVKPSEVPLPTGSISSGSRKRALEVCSYLCTFFCNVAYEHIHLLNRSCTPITACVVAGLEKIV